MLRSASGAEGLLAEAEAKGVVSADGRPPARAHVPTKELIAQVHGVVTSLLSFRFDVLTAEPLLSRQTYGKAELPSILVTIPSSLAALVQQRRGTMTPLSDSPKILVGDEADLMCSFGYEGDVCGGSPWRDAAGHVQQAMLVYRRRCSRRWSSSGG